MVIYCACQFVCSAFLVSRYGYTACLFIHTCYLLDGCEPWSRICSVYLGELGFGESELSVVDCRPTVDGVAYTLPQNLIPAPKCSLPSAYETSDFIIDPGLVIAAALFGWESLDISGSNRTVELSDLPIGGIMLACLYILDMSVIIKSNTLLPLVGGGGGAHNLFQPLVA